MRCILREFSEHDLEGLYDLEEACDKVEDGRGFVAPLSENPEEERGILREYIRQIYGFYGFGMWAVIEKKTGRLIGKAGLQPEKEGIALGYVIHPSYRRQGIGEEVCRAICSYARKELELRGILAWIRDENTASIALARKLGFRPTNEFREKPLGKIQGRERKYYEE